MNYYLIIPAHNEEQFLGDTLTAVLEQSLLPKKVLVINDHSTDTTQKIIDQFQEKYPLLEGVQISTSTDHVPGSKVINAFNHGLKRIDENYDFLVKLDADIILPRDYFEKIAYIFKGHPEVGIAGGFIYEQSPNGEWKLNHPMNKNHVRGAIKTYTKSCFKAIGGLKTAMGWDTVDELLAQYHGFDIFTDDALHVRHLRPLGKAYHQKAKLLQGRAMYTMRYGFWISCLASLKMAWKLKSVSVFQDNILGYYEARGNNSAFLVSDEEGRFIRNLRWKNIRSKLF